ncbi:MAG: ribosome maturation factor RimM [Lachnospiraceae bacterium]|nr:ribosome maturation factor RimM [Lachnospiraceae bacterium]
MQDILQVGAVTSTHGLGGEVKVFPTTDDPARFKDLKSVLLAPGSANHAGAKSGQEGALYEDKPDTMRELEVERVRFFKNLVIVKFRGLDRIEDVEGMKGCALYVTRENAVKLEEGEYFIADLIGLDVYADEAWEPSGDRESGKMETSRGCLAGDVEPDKKTSGGAGVFLGALTDVIQTGANDVYEVSLTDGRKVLIPAIRQCILDVDIEKGTMLVHLLEGLLE